MSKSTTTSAAGVSGFLNRVLGKSPISESYGFPDFKVRQVEDGTVLVGCMAGRRANEAEQALKNSGYQVDRVDWRILRIQKERL